MEGPIKGLHVTSVVVSRFAKVVIESTTMNEMAEAKEMHFSVNLPNSAFITEFKMVVAGKTIYGEVKEKVKAEQQYKKAVRAGRSGGLIKGAVRETQRFHISTNVPAQSIVVFHLVYQELLQRKLGKYDHVILINPGQIVEKFLIETTIIENSGLTFLTANCGGEENYPFSIEVIREVNLGKVKFEPSIDEQRKLRELPEVDRKIVACYDVTREVLGGEIQTRNGYFVHYFAPTCLPVLPKKVVFIIDRSWSMYGRKIAQTKDAFMSVIKELREIDRFNIVIFDCKIEVWKFGSLSGNNLLPATKENVDSAVEYVKSIKTGGTSNLNDALQEGAKLLGEVKIQDTVASMMIVLIGGPILVDNTGAIQIRSQIQEVTRGRFSIFTLGIGNNVDRTFLERLAEENDGLFRKIYQDSDADLQLKNFFKEVASPLLLHVKIKYLGTSVMDVSRSTYDQYFDGSEIVIVGVMPEADDPDQICDANTYLKRTRSSALSIGNEDRLVCLSGPSAPRHSRVDKELEDPDQICDANTYCKTLSSYQSPYFYQGFGMRPRACAASLPPCFVEELEDRIMHDIQVIMGPVPASSSQRRMPMKPVQRKSATPDELKNQPWYQNVDHGEGQSIISNIKKDGAFIVRPDDKEPGSFVLIVWANEEIHNLRIYKNKDGDYALEKIEGDIQVFTSVIELVEQFSKVCFELKDGVSVKLRFFGFWKK